MNSAPAIGSRVVVGATHRFAGTTGTVERVYPKRVCLNDDELDDPDVSPRFGALKPEWEWHVVVRVDAVPNGWPYHNRDGSAHPVFSPQVKEIEPMTGAPR